MNRFASVVAAATLASLFVTVDPSTAMAAPTATKAAKASAKPEAEDTSAPPPATMQLEVVPIAELRGPWRVRIVNTGSAPVRLAADAHLVALDIVPAPKTPAQTDTDDDASSLTKAQKNKIAARAKKKKAEGVLHCRFPVDMRPSSDDLRGLVVPPNRAYVEAFDIRAACFGAELDAITPGAMVTPHYGWISAPPSARAKKSKQAKKAARLEPPFAVSPIDADATAADAANVGPLKQIDAPSFVLQAPTTTPAPHEADDADDADDNGVATASAGNGAAAPPGAIAAPKRPRGPLKLSLPKYRDQETRIDISSPVTVKNVDRREHRTRAILFRASRLRFDVTDPTGTHVTCGAPPDELPLRELYTHLSPGNAASLPMLVSAVCDPETFSRAGVYSVKAELDDHDLGGANIGLAAFDGTLTSNTMLIRLHTSSREHGRRPPRLE